MARRNKPSDDPLELLSQYQRGGLTPSGDGLARMLFSESDRGLVIILGSWVEDALLDCVCERLATLPDPEMKALTERRPLRDFGARIQIARALGLLSEKDAAILKIIKAMRNACAHSRQDISFETPQLYNVLLMLLSDSDRKVVEDAPRDGYMPKAAFITVCSFVLGILRGETVNEAHARIIEANRSLQAATEERLEPLQGKPNDKPVRGFRQAPTNKER